MHQQRAKHDCSGYVSRDSERHQRRQRTTFDSIVGCFRGNNPTWVALSKLRIILGSFLCLIIRQDVGDRTSSSRKGSGKHANQR